MSRSLTQAVSEVATLANVSLAESLASLPEKERTSLLNRLTDEEAESLIYDWKFWARPNQIAPTWAWRIWLILAGRGFGKTRTGAEWVRDEVESGRRGRIALVGRTAADVRDVMVEGESGLLSVCSPFFRPRYLSSSRRLIFPNGAICVTYSAEEPDLLRGPQHDGAWADELAAWKKPETWDMLLFGLRLGDDPRAIVTTTPRPIKLLKELLNDPTCAVVKGSTFDNRANLPDLFLSKIVSRYEGTRLGRQELHAEILDDNPNALWKRGNLDELRVSKHPELTRIVVAIDPATTSTDESDETGIVVAGLGDDGHGYVLDDLSLRGTPDEWGREAVAGYYKLRADRIVAEANAGGDMIEFTIRTVDQNVSFKKVHASRGKKTRAEPISALYEQKKVHHVGMFAEMEDQMCEWVPGDDSPDRMDALVWALTELMIGNDDQFLIV